MTPSEARLRDELLRLHDPLATEEAQRAYADSIARWVVSQSGAAFMAAQTAPVEGPHLYGLPIVEVGAKDG